MRKLFPILLLAVAAIARADTPETVIVTYRPKSENAAEMLKVLGEARATLVRLKLVTGSYNLYRGTDSTGKTFYIEIFTWKGHEIPDNAPPDVEKVWAKENALTESRNGRPGIEIHEVESVSAESSLPAAAPSK